MKVFQASCLGRLPSRLPLKSTIGVLLLALIVSVSASSAFAQGVKIVQLNPSGATFSVAIGLNKTNQVVGNYIVSGVTKGFEYLGGSNYKTIVFPNSNNFTRANGINDSSEIVGDFFGKDNWYHGYTLISGKYTQFDLPGGLGKFSTSIFAVTNDGDLAGAAGGGTLGASNQGWVKISGTVNMFYASGTDSTFVLGINSSDQFVGQYYDSKGMSHGFSGTISGGVPSITEIIFPGAVQTACEGINDAGEITGYYIDSAGVGHGFTDVGGVFTTTDLPFTAGINAGASYVGSYVGPTGTTYGYLASPQTFAPSNVEVAGALSTSIFGVNNKNVMVGQYTDSSNVNHGLMLSGTKVTNIDDPSAAAGTTQCYGINSTNKVVGYYFDSKNLTHAFLYSGGTFTNDFIPGAVQAGALGINDAGDIAGFFVDSSNLEHGFLLKGGPGGALTQLDVPGATYTFGWGINAADTVTVTWGNSSGKNEASTYNATTKTFTTVDLPGAPSNNIHSINKNGAVVYSWTDAAGNLHGGLFMSGAYYLLDDPSGTSTRADGINDTGLIVGRYFPTGTTTYQGFSGVK